MWYLVPLGTALLGGIQGNKQRDNDIANNELQAEITKYSPWTGMTGKVGPVSGGWMSGAMQGGLSGLGLAQNMMASGMIDGPKATKASTLDIPATNEIATGWSTMDASKYWDSPELGSEFKNNRRYLGVGR